MALDIRLYFKPFCTNYSNSGQVANRIRGDGSKHQLKQTIIGQIRKYGLIKQHPLSISFVFYTVKEYPVTNYGLIAQWILETFQFVGMLQDVTPGVIAEITIKAKMVDSETKEGCLVTVDRYIKKQIPKC